jgi:DNA-binding beta-propeller fold protein YncE
MNCTDRLHKLSQFTAALLLRAIIVAVLLGAASDAIAIPAQLLITDDFGVQRYEFQSAALSNLVPDTANSGAFTGLALGPNGNLFVAANLPVPQIFEFDASSGAQVGSGPFVNYEGDPPSPDPHDVINPQGLGFSPINGNLYVGDISGSTANVHIYDSTGASLGALSDATLNQPNDVAFDAAGDLYIVNPGMANVLKSVAGTQPLAQFVGVQSGGLTIPTTLTFGPDGELYVLDHSTSNINRYNSDGSFDTIFVQFSQFQASDLEFGPDGKLYVLGSDLLSGAGQVLQFAADGTPEGALVSGGLTNPRFLVFAVPEPASLGLLTASAVILLTSTRSVHRRRQ